MNALKPIRIWSEHTVYSILKKNKSNLLKIEKYIEEGLFNQIRININFQSNIPQNIALVLYIINVFFSVQTINMLLIRIG